VRSKPHFLSRLRWIGPLVGVISAVSASHAAERSPEEMLRQSLAFLHGQNRLSVRYSSDIEAVTPRLEKIQFSGSGTLDLERPDKFRISRVGGFADVALISDGTSFTIHDRGDKRFAQVPVTGSLDQVIARLRREFHVDLPGADLFLPNAYEEMTEGVIESKHIGRGVVDGVECEHLAFRTTETDWQIWIEPGDKPAPRKYVITSKTVATAPQYTLRLGDWKFGGDATADFQFKAPPDASGVAITARSNMDEIPTAQVQGATK
jgi:hypothetical protein